MAMIDVSQVNALAQKLAAAPLKKQALVAAAVKKGAQNIKEAIQEDVQGSSNKAIRRIPIAYEMKAESTRIEADIGPRKEGAGNLANIAFFGTERGGGTHKFYGHGEDELPTAADYVRKAAEGL
ncbi:hypothetical protein [Bifidobacterium sp.]|jgi:hypothetical protein|uniref:hypothetical protein n=1 Tax=Bifidobacterium sp. TaxID=41200 RepID=UPI0025B7F249|nr:hypothetical protein [Bifidobacterium sp.]MCI1635205.1 hypothetical protein [Bifidobacterium sp.]